jgi:hypothetical protein
VNRWRWVCKHHNVDLVPSGHVVGADLECFPGISYFIEDGVRVWQLDTSELSCPACSIDATDEEIETCADSWDQIEVK